VTTAVAGERAPDFSLADLQGTVHSLAEALKKGPVALAFYKISCPICQYALPFVERIYKAYGNERVTVLGISQDDARDTREFCEEYGLTFPALMDEEGYAVSNKYGLTNVPTVVLVQPDGRVKVGGHGFSKRDLETVSKEFAAATGKPVAAVFKPGEAVPDYKPG
jgi:peroxiredoxin